MESLKPKISAVVLTRNEEDRIEDCLKTLAFTDEIIIIDNGSTDNTVQLAKKHAASVYTDKSSDFSRLRNLGREKAKFSWILYLDADERITPKLQTEIMSTAKSFNPQSSPHAYFIRRKNYYLGSEWPYRDRMERFFWKESLLKWRGKVHESPVVNGSVGMLNEPLLHYTHRSLDEMVKKTNEWSATEAKLRYASGHPKVVWWRFLRVMFTAFSDSYFIQGGWKAGVTGLIESVYQSFSMFITYAKLWEIQESKNK